MEKEEQEEEDNGEEASLEMGNKRGMERKKG